MNLPGLRPNLKNRALELVPSFKFQPEEDLEEQQIRKLTNEIMEHDHELRDLLLLLGLNQQSARTERELN